MNSHTRLVVAAAMVLLAACSKKSGSPSSDQLAAPAPTVNQPSEIKGNTPSAQPADSSVKPAAVADLSPSASSSDISIKRLDIGGYTMDVLDPNPKGVSARQNGAMVLALCLFRITEKNIGSLADAAYPMILSGGSQVLMRRDQSYRFGDGTSASSFPPFALLTCSGVSAGESSVELKSAEKVDVKSLKVGQSSMEVLNPNPKGVAAAQQPGKLLLVACAPRITDASLEDSAQSAYPIVLTEGSQLFIRRDTGYRFADGSSASKLNPGVVITCEK